MHAHKNKPMTTKEQILAIVSEYRELPADYVDIEGLMYMRKQLATHGTNLSVELGNARAKWKRADYKYQVRRTQKQIEFYQKQGNLGKSEMYAKANLEEMQEAAVEAENDFFTLDYIFRALREMLGELNQRISYLRGELKQDRFFNS